MSEQATAQREAFAAALSVQIEGRNRADLVACIAAKSGESMTVAALGHWLNASVEPTRAKILAVEQCLGLRPGTLTACFGYLPAAAKPARTVAEAIASDGALDENGRRLLGLLYRELTRR